MQIDCVSKASAAVATAVILAAITLTGCSSDGDDSDAGASESGTMSMSQTPGAAAGGTSFDITIAGSEDVAVQGTEMQCMAGSWDIAGDVDPALGTAFSVAGLPDADGELSAEGLTAKWVSPKAGYLSTSAKGFTLSDDALTVTMDNVELQSEKGTAKVSGTMVCGG